MTTIVNPRIQIELIHRRLGFGASEQTVAEGLKFGIDSLLSKLMTPSGPATFAVAQPSGLTTSAKFAAAKRSHDQTKLKSLLRTIRQEEFPAIISWWLNEMITDPRPLLEKMTLIWHSHFATSISKVHLASLMLKQNNTIRSNSLSSFGALTTALAQDPAMMIWLDTITNSASKPNENFARELMERFTIGVGSYRQEDVSNAARAFTGWRYDPQNDAFKLTASQHDYGGKTFLGQIGAFDGEEVISIILAQPKSSHFVASRIFSMLGYPVSPSDTISIELGNDFADGQNILKLVQLVTKRPEFFSTTSLNGLTKQPVEYLVGAMKALKITLNPAAPGQIMSMLRLLGQIPFDPPNVGGWPQNYYWLSTATAQTRSTVAQLLSSIGDISMVSDSNQSQRVEATIAMLGISHASSATKAALEDVSSNPVTTVALAMCSPEYVCN